MASAMRAASGEKSLGAMGESATGVLSAVADSGANMGGGAARARGTLRIAADLVVAGFTFGIGGNVAKATLSGSNIASKPALDRSRQAATK